MTWAQIKTAIRMKLGDDTGKIWSDADLLKNISDLLLDLSKDTEALTRRILFPLTSGTRLYDLPEEIVELRGVKLNGVKLNGTQAYNLEDLDATYLTATGTPIYYYQEHLESIAFYPVPSWTGSYTAFTQELGIVIQWNDGTSNYTFTGNAGITKDAIDSSGAIEFQVDSMVGEMMALDDNALVAELFYVRKPMDLDDDSDTPDLPTYMHDALIFGTCAKAFEKDGQGQNSLLAEFFKTRYNEMATEWFARRKEYEEGQDQFPSQRPVSWGSDLDWRMRVYP